VPPNTETAAVNPRAGIALIARRCVFFRRRGLPFPPSDRFVIDFMTLWPKVFLTGFFVASATFLRRKGLPGREHLLFPGSLEKDPVSVESRYRVLVHFNQIENVNLREPVDCNRAYRLRVPHEHDNGQRDLNTLACAIRKEGFATGSTPMESGRFDGRAVADEASGRLLLLGEPARPPDRGKRIKLLGERSLSSIG
jgi:hypothetical protein